MSRKSKSVSIPDEWIDTINNYLDDKKTNFTDLMKKGLLESIPELKNIKIKKVHRDLKSVDKILEELGEKISLLYGHDKSEFSKLLKELKINIRG